MLKIDKEIFYERLGAYRDAIVTFGKALQVKPEQSDLYLDGSVHRFIYCYEITWKLLRRLLKMRGVQANSPVSTFRSAYAEGWIENKELYQKMVEDRNAVTHEYFEAQALEVYSRLPEYLAEMQFLSKKIEEIYIAEPSGI